MTLDYILSKRKKYKGVLVDTNLLLLLLVGLFDEKQIDTYKRINKYSTEDFNKLIFILKYFPHKFLTTPNILTEVCNLSENFNSSNHNLFFKFLEDNINTWHEHIEKSLDLIKTNQEGFYKFGITDTSIIDLAKQNTLIITDDLKLYHFLATKNLDVINYNHLRML